MHKEEQNTSVERSVLEAIKEGGVMMRPRWQFVLTGVLAVVGGILIALVLLYVVSFIIFAVRHTGVGFAPSFGPRGWFTFFVSLPWLLILFAVMFIVILEVLVRRYSFAYRRPLLYSACSILTLVIAGGFVVASTPLHNSLLLSAEQHHFPLGEPLYRGFGDQEFRTITRGVIISTTTDGFVITSRQGRMLHVLVTPNTRLPFDSEFLPGEFVVIFGDRSTSTVEAFGVRSVQD